MLEHEHSHPHDNGSFGPFQGSPKTMFFFGLFAGIAACTTLALIFLVWSIVSGKGLSLGKVADAQAAAPTPTAQADDQQQQPPAQPVKPVDEDNDHIRGPKNAKVTLIEYSDFECPFCKRHEQTLDAVMKAYPNDIRLIYRHYPLSFHPYAQKSAEASECAAELGGKEAFWAMHDKLIAADPMSDGMFDQFAKDLKLDANKFKQCLDSGKYAAKTAQEEQEGAAAGVTGTPGTFVNGQLVEGAVPLAQFKAIVEQAMK
jgi:protein-disulfide isomerase